MGDSAARAGGHFWEEDWLDFARDQAGTLRETMARHLASPCARCAQTLRLWRAVVDNAPALPAYAAPEAAVRSVKASFATSRPAPPPSRAARAAAIVFDSLRQPALAGVRAAAPSARQVLFRSGAYLVRLSVEKVPDADRLVVVGQVLDQGAPGRRLGAVPVLAFSGRDTVERTLTNDRGEFEMEPEAADDLRLSVGVPDAVPLRLSLLAKTRAAKAPGVLGRPGRTDTRRRLASSRPKR